MYNTLLFIAIMNVTLLSVLRLICLDEVIKFVCSHYMEFSGFLMTKTKRNQIYQV